jgi:hypothetical protein
MFTRREMDIHFPLFSRRMDTNGLPDVRMYDRSESGHDDAAAADERKEEMPVQLV